MTGRDRWRRRDRPPWWPEGEQWPPRDGRRLRRRFVRRIAAFFIFASLWIAGLIAIGGWLAGRASSADRAPFPFFFPLWPVAIVVLLFVVGSAFGGRQLRRLAEPVGDLIDALGRVAAGDHTARVRETGPREVRELAAAFNGMVQRLGDAEAQRRRLLADVTHELRTPLTVVQAQLEGIVDGVYPADAAHLEPLLDQTRVLSRLIDDLRTLSLAEAGALTLHRETTDLGALIEDAVLPFRAQASSAGTHLVLDLAPDLPELDVDAIRIQEVLTNLVGNALRFTPTGGRVTVRAAREGRGVAVEVADTGAGIPADALPHVFDRFWKSPGSRGSGLGLAIAKGLVAAHGGEIEASSRGPARGTTVRFTLPEETAQV